MSEHAAPTKKLVHKKTYNDPNRKDWGDYSLDLDAKDFV